MPVTIFSQKQQRLLTEPLNSFWKPGRTFIAASNVAVFYGIEQPPPFLPDMLLSMDVKLRGNILDKKNRYYFTWEYGKPPEVIIEIVSSKKGGEAGNNMKICEHIRVSCYAIFDPWHLTKKEELRIYEFTTGGYVPITTPYMIRVRLKLILWDGVYEGIQARWIRWCDTEGNMIPTGAEWAEQAEKAGAYKNALETARRMLNKGFSSDEICELTGLAAQEINALIQK